MNKIVIHPRAGDLIKGSTGDFRPNAPTFHVDLADGSIQTVAVAELKAVFFVKDMEGRPERKDRYDAHIPGAGKKLQVTFRDGEVVIGFATVYKPERPGFFLVPADAHSNNLRIWIVSAAVAEVVPAD